jgi:hypothetical protein
MLRFESFDGAVARGRIVFPEDPAAAAAAGRRWPLLLALHGMGRTQWRWWLPEYKGRPTMESTHRWRSARFSRAMRSWRWTRVTTATARTRRSR